MTFGSLFAGIGGMDLGLECAGMECRWQVEIDPFATRVLAKHWPGVKRYGDIRGIDWSGVEPVDLIAGGFPCQDISSAGRGAGIEGAHSGLWAEYERAIRAVRPRYVLVENVAALLARGLGRVLGDLAGIGYDADWDCIAAATLGAPHARNRVWIIASDSDALHGPARVGIFDHDQAALLAARDRHRASVWVAPPHVPARVGHGPACWVDRRERTEVVGNAVVPQVAEYLGGLILAAATA